MIPGLIVVAALLAGLTALALVRTLVFKPPRGQAEAEPPDCGEPPPEALDRLSRAITFPTICTQDYAGTDFAPFEGFIAFLEEAFPLFHRTCEARRINDYALVYRWKGRDPSLKPVMLTAHYDVVPVDADTRGEWTHPGFSGARAEGRIWGRGALDIKSQLMAHLEAAEALIREGFVPKRDFYFVYGQDEETGGRNGAYRAADYFAEQGIRFAGVLDEGGFVVSGILRGIKTPLAMIGIAEKGFCNYELTLEGEGGHSSMPPAHSALGYAAKLIAAIETHPLGPRLSLPAALMLRNIAGEMGFMVRMAVANLWLFRPLLLWILGRNPLTNAMVRTTFAATMARAGDAANVLPRRARAVINVRLLPGDSIASVEEHFKKLGKGLPLSIRTLAAEEASRVSPAEGPLYDRITALIGEIYPGALATPYLVMGGTDARKYYRVCDHVYRFTPILVTNEERNTVHGINESISTVNYGRMIRFYRRLIGSFDGES
jgi:carboxypeptidase PM20D1